MSKESAVREIRNREETLIARYIPSDAWKPGLQFFSQDSEFIQAGSWGYDAGKELLPHVHNKFERASNVTQEAIYVRKGALKAKLYSDSGELIEELTLRTGDTLIALSGGHGYSILENDTQVLEIKNGPYFGAEKDRRRF